MPEDVNDFKMTEKLKSNRALLLLIENKTEDCLF